jgi:acyl carrier protein
MKDEVLALIMQKCKSLVGDKPMDAATRFEDLGAKSVDLVKMIAALEDEFGVDINFMEFRRRKTFGEAAEYVASLAG